ncbi:MAG: hypothetical protein JOZ01_08085 [Candidatus Eremiobacteraeota bacterium]|nr:hypothetical protein [Candidatus Eremiobacteraeota bacterium]
MVRRRIFSFVMAVTFGVNAAPARAVTTVPQVRHLVYSFTWGTTNSTEVHVSGLPDSAAGGGGSGGGGMNGNPPGTNGSASGITSYGGGTSDHGTIAVDVVRQQTDSGLVVNITENAVERRSAPTATCVVYGDLTVVCDPNKKITTEELTLLRLLGSNFIDPNQLDAQRHWQRQQQAGAASSTSDFTISNNANAIMTIAESRVEKDATGARPQTSDITGTIHYDLGRTIPTAIDEYTILHSEQGEQYQTVKSQTVLQLVSDSSAVKS